MVGTVSICKWIAWKGGMVMEYIPDALDMWEKHDAEQEAALEMLPICCECGNRIQDEFCFHINDEAMHISCMEEQYKVPTTHLMG
jgi:hypothetical protein